MNLGFLFCGFQILSLLLDRSVKPDVLNRHKQVWKDWFFFLFLSSFLMRYV